MLMHAYTSSRIFALGALLAMTSALAQSQSASGEASAAAAAPALSSAAALGAAPAAAPVSTMPVVIKTDIKVGTGAEALGGSMVEVHYTGWLYNAKAPKFHGKMFDTSIGHSLFRFPLGAGKVIKGWDQGVAGMRVGGKRTLIIPASLAYGAKGSGNGDIPPNAMLVFDVELFSVK